MSTPTDPASPVPPSVPIPAPGTGPSDSEIQSLAAQLGAPQLSFDPATIKKAVVTAVALGDASTPPTVSIQISGDTTTTVDGVRLASSYTPNVGDTVLLLKQGFQLFALTSIASTGSKSDDEAGGWTQATLSSGNTHGTPVMYRRVLDHGAWKMQWKGSVTYGGGTSLLAAVLDAEFRPSVTRNLGAARSNTGGASNLRIDFSSTGAVNVVGDTRSTSISLGTSGTENTAHNHDLGSVTINGVSTYLGVSFTESANHAHALGTASLSVTAPPWVALDGVEYFL